MRRKKLQPWESVMKGIKPTSYLNNMIIYTNPQPARRNGREPAWRTAAGPPSQRAGSEGERGAGGGAGARASGLAAHRPRGTFLLPNFLALLHHSTVLGAITVARAVCPSTLLSSLCPPHWRPDGSLQGHCHSTFAHIRAAHWGKVGTGGGLQGRPEGVTATLWGRA